ncbi:MAG: transposase [Pseudomonadota bacterium]|nr:transposase [Pseudomonadota bacterium]
MHVILRGIDRSAIFFADEDCRRFLSLLAEVGGTASVAVHAYVLMTNHAHLLMTGSSDNGVSAAMKGVGQRYVP